MGISQFFLWSGSGALTIVGQQIITDVGRDGYGWVMVLMNGLLFLSLIPMAILIYFGFKGRKTEKADLPV
jgi:hypothetical protein